MKFSLHAFFRAAAVCLLAALCMTVQGTDALFSPAEAVTTAAPAAGTSSASSFVASAESSQETASVVSEASSAASSAATAPAAPAAPQTAAASSQASSAAAAPVQTPARPAVSEVRAVWISYLEMQSILQNRSKVDFTKTISQYFDTCAQHGINTVVVQVRSHCDAFYSSSLFPTSVWFTGTRQSSAPFDPLAIMVSAAHKRGLLIEAWVNPYRGPKTDVALTDDEPLKKWQGSSRVFVWNGLYYLNPGEPDVRQLVADGVAEIVERYDVDGIQIDDYFYPTTDPSVDADTFSNLGGGQTLKAFRTASVNALVRTLYQTVHARKNIPFGIAPAGNLEYNLNTVYADVKLWGSTAGYADYLAPQLYWGYGEGKMPFEKALAAWKGVVTDSSVSLRIGLAAYKVGTNQYWTSGGVLAKQVTDARRVSRYAGFILFRYENYFSTACAAERGNLETLFSD